MKKSIVISALTVLALLTTGSAFADRVRAGDQGNGGCSCPNPQNIHIVKNKTNGTMTPYKPDFIMVMEGKPIPLQTKYEDPSVDMHFKDTISWELPKGACETTKVTVSWTVKNMAANGIQDNDTTGLVYMGKSIAGTVHTIPLAPGASQTFTHVLTGADAKHGRVSLNVQDDTAVTEFKVDVEACCVTPDDKSK